VSLPVEGSATVVSTPVSSTKIDDASLRCPDRGERGNEEVNGGLPSLPPRAVESDLE
jgi:hypothetical protein